ncbi:copper resistance system multicopper oxidase, partial [Tistlia consotensis]
MPKLHGGRMPRRLTPAILAVGLLLSAVAQASAGSYDLSVEKVRVERGGTTRTVIGYNGRSPGETLHFREGEDVTIRVTNRLDVPTSIHWHGMIVPTGMDGVPGLSYPGIAPGETFTYRFPVVQSGTYWFHSHSAQQEQDGAYGSIVIAPAGRDPFRYDRDYVVLLSDAHEQSGSEILSNLKRMPDYYNRQQRTLGDFFRDVSEKGLGATLADRKAWGEMRMMPTDITDVQGYRFLINGEDAGQNWTGLFAPGERIRLRFINASAMSYFDVRIPSLKMTVVQADGNDVQPVTVDEFRIAVAETYDVIVRPEAARAYTLFAAAMDRSGYARGTLAPHAGMSAAIPALGSPPLLTMADMGGMPGMEGMGHGAMAGMDHATTPGMAPASPAPDAGGAMAGMDHSKMPGMAPASPAPDAGG